MNPTCSEAWPTRSARSSAGDFSVRLPRGEGLAGEVVDRFNAVVEQADRQTRDLALIARVVGQEGSWNHRLIIEHLDGGWSEGAASVNRLVEELVRPTTELGRVLEAVAAGDLSQEAALEIEGKQLRGEFRRLGETVNQMVGLLRAFAGEVTRVAREVGTGRPARRAGRRPGRLRHLAVADRRGEHHGLQPDRAGPLDLHGDAGDRLR